MIGTIDWSRAIHIDRPIDATLLNELIPPILALRQESDAPITVGLNSPGGAVSVLPVLRSLLRTPDQSGRIGSFVTVATHQAFSAAAMLLATGDYAVALPHAEILFHDVRFGSVRDVTPSAALEAARTLEAGNERASLEIANHMFERWMWMYLDVHDEVDELRRADPEMAGDFDGQIELLNLEPCQHVRLDLVGLVLFIYKHLRDENRPLIKKALYKLARWGGISAVASRPPFRVKGSRRPGALDGLAQLYRGFFPGEEVLGGTENISDFSTFLAVLALSSHGRSAPEAIEAAARDMNVFRSLSSARHWQTAMRLMLDHKYAFFNHNTAANWDRLNEQEREQIQSESSPIVRMIWLLCVQAARELFSGERRLQPVEALVLGLVDEVSGAAPFESKRAFGMRHMQPA